MLSLDLKKSLTQMSKDPVCVEIKYLKEKEAEELLFSASFPFFYSCLNGKCNSNKDKCYRWQWQIEKYLTILEKVPWFIPSGENGIEKILQNLKNRFSNNVLELSIQKEIEQRKTYLNTDKTRNNLPNPGVLITTLDDKNTCYLTQLIPCFKSNNKKLSDINKHFLVAERIISNNYQIQNSLYDLPVFLEMPIKGESAMLPYYIKRWYEEKSITPDGSIAATGKIENDKIISVGDIDTKIKAALELGYKHIFYPASQKNEVLEKLGKLAKTKKLIPVSSLQELEQRLIFLSEYRRSKTYIKQYLEGIRPIKETKNLKKYTSKYIEGLIGTSKPKNLFIQLQNFFKSCNYIVPNRKKKIIGIFFDILKSIKIEDKNSDIHFKLSLINSLLSKPIWLVLIPYFIFDLYNKSNRSICTELYQKNIEYFYNHDLSMTVAGRLSNQLRIKFNLYKEKEFIENHPHLWGISSFDPIYLLSELSSLNNKTNFEEELFNNIFQEFIKTFDNYPESIYSIGITPQKINKNIVYDQYSGINNAKKYFKCLLKTIDSIFPGFRPQKFRYLRWDQKLGNLSKILFYLSKNKEKYNSHIKKLLTIIKTLLDNAVFKEYKYSNLTDELKEMIINPATYESIEGIKLLLHTLKEFLEAKEKGKEKGKEKETNDSYIRYLTILSGEEIKYDVSGKSIVDIISSFYLKNDIVNSMYISLINKIKSYEKNNSVANETCLNPVYDIPQLLLEPNDNNLCNWLLRLNNYCFDFENIFSVNGFALFLAYYLGQHYKGKIPQNFLQNQQKNKSVTNIFLLSYCIANKADKELNNLIEVLKQLRQDDKSFIFLIKDNYYRTYLSENICKENNNDFSIKKLYTSTNINNSFNILTKNNSKIFQIIDSKPDNISWKEWKYKVKSDLFESFRSDRKMYFIDMLWNHPKEFLRLPFSELDPENYSLTLLYFIAKERYSQNKNLLKKIKRKILVSGRNLFDLETIQTIELVECFNNNNYKKIQKLLLSNRLNLMNMKIAYYLLEQKASK